MKRARTFRSANAQMRQLGFGMVDLKLHREYDPEQGRRRARLCARYLCAVHTRAFAARLRNDRELHASVRESR